MTWDFERIVLAVTGLLIAASLGYAAWSWSVADELRLALKPTENRLSELGVLAFETFDRQEELRRDGVGRDGPYKYLNDQMRTSRIGKRFNIGQPSTMTGDGFEDVNYTLTPAQADYTFTLEQVGVFLLYVERKTQRMKVTRIRLDRSSSKDAGTDDWKPTLTITDRRPLTIES